MIPISKVVEAIPPGVIKDNAAFVVVAIDTIGFDLCVIDVNIGVTDKALAVFTVTESETSGGVYTAVSDMDGDTDIDGTTAVLPIKTNDNKIWRFIVDCRYRKRFLKVNATAGDGTAGTYLAALAHLYRADNVPSTSATMGTISTLQV